MCSCTPKACLGSATRNKASRLRREAPQRREAASNQPTPEKLPLPLSERSERTLHSNDAGEARSDEVASAKRVLPRARAEGTSNTDVGPRRAAAVDSAPASERPPKEPGTARARGDQLHGNGPKIAQHRGGEAAESRQPAFARARARCDGGGRERRRPGPNYGPRRAGPLPTVRRRRLSATPTPLRPSNLGGGGQEKRPIFWQNCSRGGGVCARWYSGGTCTTKVGRSPTAVVEPRARAKHERAATA